MTGQTDLVTVYRTSDENAEKDAASVHELLLQNGMASVLVEPGMPGVAPGTWEVRVPEAQVERAESVIRALDKDNPSEPDPSAEFDSVTIMDFQGATGEIEAMGVKSVLDANGIPNVLVGNQTLPNLMFLIKVPASEVERARQAIAEARAAGPAAAVEAERAYEEQAPPEVQ